MARTDLFNLLPGASPVPVFFLSAMAFSTLSAVPKALFLRHAQAYLRARNTSFSCPRIDSSSTLLPASLFCPEEVHMLLFRLVYPSFGSKKFFLLSAVFPGFLSQCGIAMLLGVWCRYFADHRCVTTGGRACPDPHFSCWIHFRSPVINIKWSFSLPPHYLLIWAADDLHHHLR